jgi:hypothetical protein
MTSSRLAQLSCVLLGLTLITAACGGKSSPGAASTPRAGSPAPGASSQPAATTPPASPASPASPAAGAVPGVVADCTSAPPYGLTVRPGSVTLACADNGAGVEYLSWTTWTAGAAAGHGSFWLKLCQPSCAAGSTGTYPATVTLSDVQASAEGPWFSRMTVAWTGARPPASTPDSYPLQPPGSG